MSAQSRRIHALSLCVAAALVLLSAGCQSRQTNVCNVEPWDSPTTRATRALLVVPRDELTILEVDGRDVWGPQITETHGMRGYLIPAGERTITASFRYAAPVTGGLTGAIRGDGIELKHVFDPGREYVAIYRIHARPRPEARWWLEHLVNDVFAPQRYSWTMEIAELNDIEAELTAACLDRRVAPGPALRERLSECHDDLARRLAAYLAARGDLEAEIRQALLYRSIPAEMEATMIHAKRHYQSATQ